MLHSFENGNTFTGSYGSMRFKATPNVVMLTPKEVNLPESSIRAEVWHGPLCYEKSEMEDERTFPMSEEGRAELHAGSRRTLRRRSWHEPCDPRVTDFAAPELDVSHARTTENQLVCREDPENGKFIAETPMVIERALDAGYVPISFLMEEKYLENQGKPFMERCPDVPVYTAELSVLQNLDRLSAHARNVSARCAAARRREPSALCKTSRRIAVLENVMNPTNVGAIFRSAAALGMDAVLLTPGCSDPFYRRAIRVAMGTVFQIPWTYVDEDWPELLKN